ncbi:MAG: oligopeptide transporter, OPT family [Planctomycetota bacterium]
MDKKGLPPSAYKPIEGEAYQSYTAGKSLPEFTLKAVVTGIALGIVFGAANTYLGLKSGLTISTSIPVAVLTLVVFRILSGVGKGGSILEANMSQTIGSASSSVASGVLFTIPALFIWGMEPAWRQLTLLAMSGGLIGVLCMVPLRRYLIKDQHGKLPYPEGMACAEVLVAADSGHKQASSVFAGFGFGVLVKLITDGLKLIPGSFKLGLGGRAELSCGLSPALIGVGYILGPRVASVMVGGAALSAFAIIPAIAYWGREFGEPFYPETELLIRDMSASEIWNRYVRYIGAGAVATAGIITLIESIPTMLESFKLGFRQMGKGQDENIERGDRDLSFKTVLIFMAGIVLVLAFVPGVLGAIDSLAGRGLAAVLAAVFAFFFVTVASRIVGMVGVTSNPTSGMTIATLLGTSFIFYLLGWTDQAGKATALMVGTVVCIAASISGDTSQDLKTGFILGATPRRQQIGELLGVITSAGVVCWTLILLDGSAEGGFGGPELPAPQGVLMNLVITGVLEQNLPWALIFIGVGIALVVRAAKLPVLAFAVGVYLPLSTMAPVFLGGLLRWWLGRGKDAAEGERRRERGVLFGSGLVGGAGLTGVILALWVVLRGGGRISGLDLGLSDAVGNGLAMVGLAGILLFIAFHVVSAGKPDHD